MDSCELFPELTTNSALKVWQTFYCSGDFKKCVRFQQSTKGQAVPITLLPNGKDLDTAYLSDKIKRSAAQTAAAPASQEKPQASTPATNNTATTAAASPAINSASVSATSSYYVRFKANGAGEELQQKAKTIIEQLGIKVDGQLQQPVGEGYKWFIFITDQASGVDIYRAALRIEELGGIEGQVKCISLEPRS